MAGWTHTGYAQQIHFRAGALDLLAEVTRELGLRRIMLVTTEGRHASDDGKRLARLLGRSLASTFAEARSHVPTTTVQAAVMQARRDAVDGIVSFGGGSCADLGKAVAFFTEQEAGTPGASYADRAALPHVSVPTTYSGAELTPFFGMTDETARRKSGAGGPTVAPMAAIYDPRLTLTTPPRISAETGVNALAHCIEVVWSPQRTPEAEAIALAGCRVIVSALPKVVSEPDDLAGRTAMLEGAVLGGRALQNATMGVHHGLAQLVGGRTGMAHGLANALILPHAMRFNQAAVPDAMARIGEAIGAPDDPAAAVADLIAAVGLGGGLSDHGFDDDDLDAVVRQVDGNRSIRSNPRPVTADDARAVLEAAW